MGADWARMPKPAQRWLRGMGCGFLLLAGLALAANLLAGWALTAALGWLAEAQPGSWGSQLLAQIAPNWGQLPASGYVAVATRYLNLGLGALAAALLVAILVLALVSATRSRRALLEGLRTTLIDGGRKVWRHPLLWTAALAVGITTAVRIVGPFAAALVLLYLLIKKGPQSLSVALPYLGLSALVTYLLWPFLWQAPVTHFLDSIGVMTRFPWEGRVLFEGDLTAPERLPAYYLPKLLSIQLTLPALALLGVGLAGILPGNRKQGALLATVLTWFLLPLAYIVLRRPILYHNFRQFLFIVPPLFLIAAVGIAWLRSRVKAGWAAALLALLVFLPGIRAIASEHPYEYVYYNELVGGLPGAAGQYELEYWRSAYTEIGRELNLLAPAGSSIGVWGSVQMVRDIARSGLRVELVNARNFEAAGAYDYLVLPVRGVDEQLLIDDFPTYFKVSREGVDLAVVSQP